MVYVALLRGINVGGKAKVEMSRLKQVFEQEGCSSLTTYINSGNVVFKDARSRDRLTSILEAAIYKEFQLRVPVLLRDADNIRKLCHGIPASWNNKEQRTDVIFLWQSINDTGILSKIDFKPEIESVSYEHDALIWHVDDRKNATKSKFSRIITTSDIYKNITIRNINTVRKLDQLMQASL